VLTDSGRLRAAGTLLDNGWLQAETLAEALTLELSLAWLCRARELIVDDKLRLFFALLLTGQDRRFVTSSVTDYTGVAEQSGKVAAWIHELGAKGMLNVEGDSQTERIVNTWLKRVWGGRTGSKRRL
jgi:hypothetical protein